MSGATLGKIGAGLVALGLLAACGGANEPQLMNLKSPGNGPDEFAILPTKPLQAPESYASLPAPTPGSANRTDPTPKADAVAALGGNPGRLSGGGVQDPALIGHTTRFGVQPTIRQELAALDLQYRRDNDGRLLERLFNVSVYFKAYRKFELDQYRELERFRRAGVRTPAVPPEQKR
ncbi:DUF3035 domain-containing protein [Oceaniglobus ichthyenteri]|uniref:DUF3035 domain-containing protein n=1 Tax=Oceaniglobus ichthyenteri TaxID=2136177 RepID=UPI000D3A7033|nr:DUF3035 domain-containing protein [Oceaniglobus ichthyenteri]